MFQRLSTSFELVKIAFSYIKQEGELFVYALLSFLSSAIILASFAIGGFFYIAQIQALPKNQQEIISYAVMFIFYLIMYFITFFFNTAIITTVKRKLNGEESTFGDGMKDCFANLGKILQWSLVSATVSLILRIIESKFKEGSFIGKMIIRILGGSWSILTFFAFPMMIVQGKGPIDAIKESGALFRKTWGEMAILNVGSSLFFGVLIVLAVFASVGIAIFTNNIIFGVILVVASIIFLGLLSSLTEVIVTTLLLHYASTETVPENLDEKLAFASIARTI